MASSSSSSSSSSSTKLALAFVMATWLLFFRGDHSEEEEAESSSSSSSSSSSGKRGQALVSGLGFSFIATLGNTAASMLRKQLSSTGVSPAEQVGLATLIQGFVALVYCQTSGVDLARAVRDRSFVAPAVASSTLNALTKTLETRAYATTDVSLCAPFLAFDPVFQFLLPAIFAPVLCSTFGWLCGEAAQTFPASHPAAVGSIAAGAFLLKQTASSSSSSKDDDGATSKKDDRPSSGRRKKTPQLWGGLPLGSWFILLNCVIYSVTSRLDKAAVLAAGSKTAYFTYGRFVMGTAAFASAKPTKRTLRKFLNPHALVLLLSVCTAEGLYLLSMYEAFARVSPVYVTAIKRGGGLLFSAFASAIFFNESLTGRYLPIAAIVSGVVALCL